MRFLDPGLVTNPYVHYRQWRNKHPLWRDEMTNAWVLSRHDDVRRVLKNSVDYSSAAMKTEMMLPVISDDPPRHTQLRGIVNKAFTSRILKQIEGDVREIATGLASQLPVNQPVDVTETFTSPLPVAVISQMMGIPQERGNDFKRWSDSLTGTLAGASIEDRRSDIAEMASYFASLIPERRSHPSSDLISEVVTAELDGQGLTDQEIVGFCVLLLIAGNETTTNLIGNFLNILAERTDLWTQLRQNPKLVDAGIEEALRLDSPVQFLRRRLINAVTFYGRTIAAGEDVYIVTGSANRDSRIYESPDEFRLDRIKNHHHSFGFGIHFCIGAPLARLEAKLGMEALLSRFKNMQRAQIDDVRMPFGLLRGFSHLWLNFEE
jgi:cytochrome P450